MGLQDVFKKAAQTAIRAAGNIPVTVSCSIIGQKTYDEETDTVAKPEQVFTGIKMVMSKYPITAFDELKNIRPSDVKALVAVEDLDFVPAPDVTVLVTSSASATFRSGDTYNIITHTVDEAEALYTLQLRGL